MKKYIKNLKTVVGKNIYILRLYDFFSYFYDERSQFLFSNPFLKSIFSLTGFSTPKKLVVVLDSYVFDEKQKKEIYFKNVSIRQEEVISVIVREVSRLLKRLSLKSKLIRVVVFPTFSKYLKNKSHGISGYTVPSGKLFFIFINPQIHLDGSRLLRIKKLIAHELNHLVFEESHKEWEGIIGSVVEEGLAGHFEALMTDGKPSEFFKMFSKTRCLKSWLKVKKILYSFDLKTHSDLFFNYNKSFPLNFGYSLGYQIVGDFLKKNKGLSWQKIMKMPSQKVLEKSGWLDY